MSDEDDAPQLSAETFLVLQQFYKEQEERDKFNLDIDSLATDGSNSIDFTENWQLSQFWYDDSTIAKIVDIARKTVEENGKIALISCPSLYKQMKKSLPNNCHVNVYEFDKRFAAFGSDFTFYDYKSPLEIPRDKSSYYDLVIADPPFLSDECLTKTAVTIKFLAKEKIILCTGATMCDMVKRLLNLQKTSFEPHHKNNLGNEFWCYSNYNIDKLLQ